MSLVENIAPQDTPSYCQHAMVQTLTGLKELIPDLFTTVDKIRKLIRTILEKMRYRLSSSHCSLHELYLLTVLRTAVLLAEGDFPSPAGNCLAPFSIQLHPWLIAHEL